MAVALVMMIYCPIGCITQNKDSSMSQILPTHTGGDLEPEDMQNNVNITKLKCEIEADLKILLDYDNTHMIGDSLLHGQFLVFLCIMDLYSAFSMDKQGIEYKSLIQQPDS
jgi:hypothetical protein